MWGRTIRDYVILGGLVVFMVGAMLYAIAPQELRIAYTGIIARLSEAATERGTAIEGLSGWQLVAAGFVFLLPFAAVCGAVVMLRRSKERAELRRKQLLRRLEHPYSGSAEMRS
jgi:hypothetical protein